MLTKSVSLERAPASTSNFAKVNRILASEFRQVANVWNGRAERPTWQTRYFLIHAGEAIFIDVLDAPTSRKPIKAVVHNRAWDEPVSASGLTHIYSILTRADVPFFISKGVKHGD